MNQKIHPAKIGDHLGGKALQRAFVAYVPHKIGIFLHVDHGDARAVLRKFPRDRPANALRTARHDGDLSCKHALSSPRALCAVFAIIPQKNWPALWKNGSLCVIMVWTNVMHSKEASA